MNSIRPILLVEDSAADIELTIAALQDAHMANPVIVLRDGSEALEYLDRHCQSNDEESPAVVLLDIKMPKVSGFEVLRMIKNSERLRNTPVVMLTSSREGPDVRECYRLGANSYVVKPVEFNEFFDAVKEVGKYWAITNEPATSDEHAGKDQEIGAGR